MKHDVDLWTEIRGKEITSVLGSIMFMVIPYLNIIDIVQIFAASGQNLCFEFFIEQVQIFLIAKDALINEPSQRLSLKFILRRQN
jgi:hypothetical protein